MPHGERGYRCVVINHAIRYGAEVAAAREAGSPVVALESTIISHGLPRPSNLTVARDIEATVRAAGAVPATIGMLGGEIVVGLSDEEIVHLAGSDDVVKLSVRDLAPAAAGRADGATTVAATSAIAVAAGIAVFATGGLGGVHRGAGTTFDESADLTALSRLPITVVCAGVKSILDVGATLERLETLGVSVVGYGTRRFPGFYLTDGGFDLDWSVDDPAGAAAIVRAARAQAVHQGATIIANPLPADEQLDPDLHDRVLAEGLAGLERDHVTGKDVTPHLLSHFHAATEGRSLDVNVRIILRNADLAARIAAAL
ncbi:pseudouridine-5'-phosphate glycosidase [Dactylosporangium sp. NPDC049742]|uniref:pseudouridine-5'-phosphate glycosidase n=1 Tax=Dactylosporangium sp. NPDC049742 TaxID=3154737 RepID=UPI00342D46E7